MIRHLKFSLRNAITLLGLTVIGTVNGKDFYVSPAGNDTDVGTSQRPFATLAHAKKIVSQWNEANGNEDIDVWLYGGEYRLREPIVFTKRDGAKKGQTIRYIAIPGQKPVISSDVELAGWTLAEENLIGLPAAAAGKIWKTKVPPFVKDFKVAYHPMGFLPRASVGPIAHLLYDDEVWGVGPDSLHTRLPFEKGTTRTLFNPQNVEILVVPNAPWTVNRLSVKKIDTEHDIAYFRGKSTYALVAPRFYHSEEAIWIENTFAGLDSPGKWVFDSDSRYFYHWPLGGPEAPTDVVIPCLTEYVRINGHEGVGTDDDFPVEGIEFIGLTFRHGDRYDMAGRTGLGLQHDWELFDAPTAMVRFRGSKRCAIRSCTFVESGGAALRFDLYAKFNKVIDNNFLDLGGTAVLLAGYGPGRKDVNNYNEISNNTIDNIGTIWWHSIAIWAWQSGYNRIAHNTISNVPYTAIAVTGRIQWDASGEGEGSRTVRWDDVKGYSGNDPWEHREQFLHGRYNRIEYNDIRGVVNRVNDGNGIYISGAGKGNEISGNFLHDTPSDLAGEAIRCDDDQHETTIKNNIIYRFGTNGIGLCSKGRNYFLNNIVALPPGRVNRGMLSLEPTTKGICAGSVISNNIFYTIADHQPLVYLVGMKSEIEGITIDGNIYFSRADSLQWDSYLGWARSLGRETNSVQADPMFEDIENGNFKLKPNSPAINLGFKTLELLAGRKENDKK